MGSAGNNSGDGGAGTATASASMLPANRRPSQQALGPPPMRKRQDSGCDGDDDEHDEDDDVAAIAAAAVATINAVAPVDTISGMTSVQKVGSMRDTRKGGMASQRKLRGRILRHRSTLQRTNAKQKEANAKRLSNISKYAQRSSSVRASDLQQLENTSVRIADWLGKQHQAYYRSSNRGDLGPATFRKSWLFSPLSQFVQVWKAAMAGLTLVSVWWVLFDWAFKPPPTPTLVGLEIAVELVFIIDILLHFRITYPDESTLKLVTDEWAVARNFLRTSFPLDMLGTLPVLVVFFLPPGAQYGFKLLRMARIARIWNAERMRLNYKQLLHLLAYFATLAHFVACMWYGICGAYHLKHYPGENNLIGREFEVTVSSPLEEKYTYSMYYGLLLVLGENIPPSTVAEAWFAWAALFLGCVAFSAVVGQVTVLLQELHHERNRYYERLLALDAKMRILKIPRELRARVMEWLEYCWDRFNAQDANALFADENPSIPMPRSLRTELALHAHAPMLLTCPLFYGAEEGFIAEVAMMLRLRISSAGDLIIQKDESDESMMFLKAGEAFILSPLNGTDIIVSLEAGSFFGELSVVFGGKRSASIRAATYCELVVLSREHLEDAWKVYPQARSRILDMAHRRRSAIKKMNADEKDEKEARQQEKGDKVKEVGWESSCTEQSAAPPETEKN